MSSSTSSSNVLAAGPGGDPAPRGPYLKILLTLVIVMGASMALVRGFTALNDASAETILDRVMEARTALPRIVQEEKPLVISFGSSMTEAGFAARQFDREMADREIDVKSYNFGFGGLNPYFQDYLSRRIRDSFVENDRRLKLALIEFTPLQNTTARWNGAQSLVDSFVTMLSDDSDVWEIIKENPTRGIRVAEIKYLRNDISAEMITHYFGGDLFETPRPRSGVEPDEEKDDLLNELGEKINANFDKEFPDFVDENWSFDWQGAGTIPEDRFPETVKMFAPYFEALRSEQRLSDDRLRRINCCDIEELHFEETLVAAFIRTVKNFQEFSDEVEVILMPRNHDWIQRGPEAWDRINAVLERVTQETGVRVRSFEDWGNPQMFSDTTHLARYGGDVPYTSMLVETYAEALGR